MGAARASTRKDETRMDLLIGNLLFGRLLPVEGKRSIEA
jgi:hypothetical protein